MEISALLCDHAQVSGKLFISGANINRFAFPAGSPAPYPLTFAVAGVVEVPWTATNSDHRLTFHLLTQHGQVPQLGGGAEAPSEGIGGEIIFNVGRPPGMDGEEQLVPFAFNVIGLPMANAGQYSVTLQLDGREARRLCFTLAVEPNTTFRGGAAAPGHIG